MKIVFYLSFLFTAVLVLSCKKDLPTEPPFTGGSIQGNFFIGVYQKTPKYPIKVRLDRIENQSTRVLDSAYTDSRGRYVFRNLTEGMYSIVFTQDKNYTPFRAWQPGDALANYATVNKTEPRVRLDFSIHAWHHLTQDTIVHESDTTGGWNTISTSVKFFNDGVRDSLNWQINIGSIPAWLAVDPIKGNYPPEAQSDRWLTLTIHRFNFPDSMWNRPSRILIDHQFGSDTLTVIFKVRQN